jgi:hypothetical protein
MEQQRRQRAGDGGVVDHCELLLVKGTAVSLRYLARLMAESESEKGAAGPAAAKPAVEQQQQVNGQQQQRLRQ